MEGNITISKQTLFNTVVLSVVLGAIAFFATRSKEVAPEPDFPAPYIRPLPKKCDCFNCSKHGQLGEAPPVVKSL